MYPGWVTAKLFQFRSRDDQGYTNTNTHTRKREWLIWCARMDSNNSMSRVMEKYTSSWMTLKQPFTELQFDLQWPFQPWSSNVKRSFKHNLQHLKQHATHLVPSGGNKWGRLNRHEQTVYKAGKSQLYRCRTQVNSSHPNNKGQRL